MNNLHQSSKQIKYWLFVHLVAATCASYVLIFVGTGCCNLCLVSMISFLCYCGFVKSTGRIKGLESLTFGSKALTSGNHTLLVSICHVERNVERDTVKEQCLATNPATCHRLGFIPNSLKGYFPFCKNTRKLRTERVWSSFSPTLIHLQIYSHQRNQN